MAGVGQPRGKEARHAARKRPPACPVCGAGRWRCCTQLEANLGAIPFRLSGPSTSACSPVRAGLLIKPHTAAVTACPVQDSTKASHVRVIKSTRSSYKSTRSGGRAARRPFHANSTLLSARTAGARRVPRAESSGAGPPAACPFRPFWRRLAVNNYDIIYNIM